ncbi:hypothetical protein F5X98DRAFT_374291 [Xylaria grammica]|nr:hypothetical protein F5X98DRAFT_374291 [Xylaria grammica]
MFSPDSITSSSSEESYTSRMLAEIRQLDDHYDRMVSSTKTSHSKPPSCSSSALPNSNRSTSKWNRYSVRRRRSQERESPADDPLPSGADRPESPPWILNPVLSPQRPPRTWRTRLKEIWDAIRVCFGRKSVGSPYD